MVHKIRSSPFRVSCCRLFSKLNQLLQVTYLRLLLLLLLLLILLILILLILIFLFWHSFIPHSLLSYKCNWLEPFVNLRPISGLIDIFIDLCIFFNFAFGRKHNPFDVFFLQIIYKTVVVDIVVCRVINQVCVAQSKLGLSHKTVVVDFPAGSI